MENSDSLISKLLEITNKKELNSISNFRYINNEFIIHLNEDDFNKIHSGDIVLYNHKTNQYRIFKYKDKNENSIIFMFNNLNIKIIKTIDSE